MIRRTIYPANSSAITNIASEDFLKIQTNSPNNSPRYLMAGIEWVTYGLYDAL